MASIPPTTNWSPQEALATFVRLGTRPLSVGAIPSVLLRDLVARGVYLAGHIASPDDQAEFDLVYQELAVRMMGRDAAFK